MDNDAPSYTALVPMVPVTDVTRTTEFFEKLGFTVGATHAPEADDVPVWAWLYNGQTNLMVTRSEHPVEASHTSATIWLYTQDVEATHQLLRSRGFDVGTIEHPPYNPRGEFHVHDPDGYAIFIAHAD